MNGTVRNILYSPLWLFLHGAAFLPLPVLYVISDVLAFLTYHVVRYRRELVKKNIYASFATSEISSRSAGVDCSIYRAAAATCISAYFT